MPETSVDLAGAWLKLARAEKHRAELAVEVDAFLARNPFGSRHTTEPGEGGVTVHRLSAVVREQPPVEWAPIIGDAVHNLRSALDHAVWAIAEPGDRYERAQYPVYSEEAEYDRNAPRLLAGVSPRRCDLIRGTQPFRWPMPNRLWHELAVLHDLDITDKHKTLHTVATVSEFQSIAVDNAEVRITYKVGEGDPLADGAEVLRYETQPEDPDRPIVATPQADHAVSIEGTLGISVLDRLRSLARFVEWGVLRPLEDPDNPMFVALPLDPPDTGAQSRPTLPKQFLAVQRRVLRPTCV